MIKAVSLNCPQCGAQLKRSDKACEHCGTSVRFSTERGAFDATGIACPACLTPNSPADKHCGGCGELIQATCQTPNCHQVNSVWRKFCSKCGKDLAATRSEAERAAYERAEQSVDYHKAALDTISGKVGLAKARAVTVKSGILIVGLGFAGIVGASSESFGLAVGIGVIVVLIWSFYESDEVKNLEKARKIHEDDLARAEAALAKME